MGLQSARIQPTVVRCQATDIQRRRFERPRPAGSAVHERCARRALLRRRPDLPRNRWYALLAELHEDARSSRPPTPGEIADDEVHEAITDLWDALAEQERREYTDYAERLTSAVQARLAALDLPTPVTVNIKLAPEGTHSSYDFDDHAPATYPRNAIEAAIDDAIAHTPTPSALPDTPRDRLSAAQP